MSRRNVGDQSEQIFILALRIDHRIHSADSLHDRIEFALAEFFLLHINELKFNSSFLRVSELFFVPKICIFIIKSSFVIDERGCRINVEIF